MPSRRLSLHSVVALSLVGMGVVALALVLLSSRIYRDVSHENRATAVRDLVGHRAGSTLDHLAQAQELLALRLVRGEAFASAWPVRDREALRAYLASVVERGHAGGGESLPLRQVRLLDAELAPVVAAGESGSPGCEAALELVARAGNGAAVRRTCLGRDRAAMSVIVALPDRQPGGYVEVVADPVARLQRIADDPGLAIRIERPGGALLFESGDWGMLATGPAGLSTRLLAPSETGEPVFAIRAAADVGRLNRQLGDTRDFVLLAAGVIVAAAMLTALVALRRMLQPLRALQTAAENMSQEAGRAPAFTPVPERGPAEIATPIHSFNEMVERISDLVGDLEAEVGQRRAAQEAATAAQELAEANARQASREKEFSHLTLESIVDAVITTDTAGHVEYVNPVAEELTGIPEREARGRDLDEIVQLYAVDGDERVRGVVAGALSEDRHRGEREVARLMQRGGRVLYVEHAVVPMHDAAGESLGAVIVFHDITQAHLLTERLTYQATHDALTGLINRYEFEGRLRRVVEAARDGEANGVLCYLDLDQFKLVNDTCGHVAGDELLRQLAVMLRDRLADRGTLARLGGDEFGMLLHPSTVAEAHVVADELRDAIQRFRFVWAESIFTIGVSVGLVEVTRESDSTDVLLSAADTACYMAKDSGRNRVQVYHSEDEALLARHAEMHWVSEINRALEEDRLQLYYQDILATEGDRDPCHFEILLRMIDDEGQVWLPGAFLSAAERYNLAPAIDRWVIRRAFAWLAAAELPADALYSINLSGRSLAHDGFLQEVIAELDRSGVDPINVCFEVTETAAISNLSHARSFMETLRRRGVRFSLDDFGSGLSSFTYLKNLPVDFLKIDGAFVRDIHLDAVHYSIVRSMNDVGHAMQMLTVAEFVENRQVMQCLRDIGVDFLQGFEYSRPRPLDPEERVAVEMGQS